MKFSIITPTYNSHKTLTNTVDSVLSQDGVELEYLIVDGASTDKTLDIVNKYAANDTRISWVSEPDAGIADAFNKGLAMATGDWVGIINSDDIYAPSALELVAEAISQYPDSDVVHGDLLRIDAEGKAMFVFTPDDLKTLWHKMPISHPTTFVSRKAYDKVGGFNPRWRIGMDHDLFLRLSLAGAKFRYVDKILAHMRSGGVSDTDIWAGLFERRLITMSHGYPRYKAEFWFLYNGLVGTIKKMMRRYGLHKLLTLHPRFK